VTTCQVKTTSCHSFLTFQIWLKIHSFIPTKKVFVHKLVILLVFSSKYWNKILNSPQTSRKVGHDSKKKLFWIHQQKTFNEEKKFINLIIIEIFAYWWGYCYGQLSLSLAQFARVKWNFFCYFLLPALKWLAWLWDIILKHEIMEEEIRDIWMNYFIDVVVLVRKCWSGAYSWFWD